MNLPTKTDLKREGFLYEATLLYGTLAKRIKKWPPGHRRTIGDQMLRASLSVVSNYAEGFGRRGLQQVKFVDIAQGSLQELIGQIRAAMCAGLLDYRFARGQRARLHDLLRELCEIQVSRGKMSPQRRDMLLTEFRL